jgi:hypothetical protein
MYRCVCLYVCVCCHSIEFGWFGSIWLTNWLPHLNSSTWTGSIFNSTILYNTVVSNKNSPKKKKKERVEVEWTLKYYECQQQDNTNRHTHILEGQHTHIRSRSSGGVECCSAAHSIERHTYRSLPFVRYATHSHSYLSLSRLFVCLLSVKQPYMYVCGEGRVKRVFVWFTDWQFSGSAVEVNRLACWIVLLLVFVFDLLCLFGCKAVEVEWLVRLVVSFHFRLTNQIKSNKYEEKNILRRLRVVRMQVCGQM